MVEKGFIFIKDKVNLGMCFYDVEAMEGHVLRRHAECGADRPVK